MVEEKTEKHEHEQHHESSEAKTVTMKKSTLWGVGAFVLLVLLVVSVFTSGFGIMKPTGNAAANNNANAGATGATGNTNLDPSIFLSNSNLYPSLGPSNAKATVIEVGDFQCPYCAMASGLPSWTSTYASQYGDLVGSAGKAEQLAQQGKIRFIFVPWSFLGQESIYAGEAAYCAGDQNKYFEMHDAIYTASNGPSEDTGKYTKANLTVIAQSVSGLDMTKFNNCLSSDTDLAKIQQVTSDVKKSGVTGTPMFFVNGKQVQASWAAIQAAINAA